MSGRPVESWATIGARLAAVAASDPPPWVTPDTARAVRAAVEGLRADLRRAAAGLSRRAAAVALGVGDGSWARWTRRGGWLDMEER